MKICKVLHNTYNGIGTALQREIIPQRARMWSTQTLVNYWKLYDFLECPMQDIPQLIIKHIKERKANLNFYRYLRKY